MKFTFVLIVINLTLFSQNLILNSSFEEMTNYPTKLSEFNFVKHWFIPNLSTPDYFCKCIKSNKNNLSDVPFNSNGYQTPKSGKCYVGLILKNNSNRNNFEFISARLIKPLEKKKYCIQFYYSLANFSIYKVSQIGVFLSDSIYLNKKTSFLSRYKPQISNRSSLSTDTLDWNLFCQIYNATGNEKFLTIGGLTNQKSVQNDNSSSQKQKDYKVADSEYLAYYYIDDVSLIEITDLMKCPCGNTDVTLVDTNVIYIQALNKSIVIENIVFEINKSVLIDKSFKELNKLAEYLTNNINLKIELSGHTDNTGTEEANLILSEARAKAVADYLIKMGIESKRIKHKGYGSSRPLKPNTTEENKFENRRVELKLIK